VCLGTDLGHLRRTAPVRAAKKRKAGLGPLSQGAEQPGEGTLLPALKRFSREEGAGEGGGDAKSLGPPEVCGGPTNLHGRRASGSAPPLPPLPALWVPEDAGPRFLQRA